MANKFAWVIKNFSSLQSEKCYSVPVMNGDCKWHLLAYPKGGKNSDNLSLFLEVAGVDTLPLGWVRYVKLRVTIVNQLSQKLSIINETEGCFDGNSTSWGFPSMLSIPKLHDKNGGFLACGDLIIVAELDVLEVIGTLDSSKKSQEASEHGNDIADDLEVIGTLDSSEKSQEASKHSAESNDLADDLEAMCTLKEEPAVRQEINQRPKRKIVLITSMAKKFGWVIKDSSALSEKCYSVPVLISDCKWRLLAFPKGNSCDNFSLYLDVADCASLPCGWRRYAKLRLTIVNQLSQKLSIVKEIEHCFDGKSTTWVIPAMLPLSTLYDKAAGFLVDGEVMIVAELDVFEVSDILDAAEKSEVASELVSEKKQMVGDESNELVKKSLPAKESNNVNGTKQVKDPVISSLKNKLMWTTILILVLLLIGSVGAFNELLAAIHKDLLVARERISDLERLLRK